MFSADLVGELLDECAAGVNAGVNPPRRSLRAKFDHQNCKNRRKVAIIKFMTAAAPSIARESTGPKKNTMLIAFQAQNVRSFRDRIEFSLEATPMSEDRVVRELPWRLNGRNFVRILPVAGVFGANASGKSNLLAAMEDMRRFVRESYVARRHSEHSLRWLRRPFRLDEHSAEAPSTYEIDLILDGIRHEYGFVVDDNRVLYEWAKKYTNGKPAVIFERSPAGLRLADQRSAKARAVKELLRDEALFLSIAEAAGYEPLLPLYKWFDRNFVLCDASTRDSRSRHTAELMAQENRRLQVLELLQIADLGITDARQHKPDDRQVEMWKKLVAAIRSIDELATDDEELGGPPMDLGSIQLSHKGANGNVEFHSFEESLGTMVWLGLIGPLLEALINGTMMLVDELEASLHPLLVERFVRMFQNPVSNPNGAQLIFNSHEAKLLGNSETDRIIGRDQAWFTEKSDDGSTRLFPLTDLNPRKSEAVAKRYLQGRYGATPILSGDHFIALAAMLAESADHN
jgi:uncharacterized protein